MVFASLIFLCVFLPIHLGLYYLARGHRLRNWILVVSSVIFYAWGEPLWIILLILSSSVDYAAALFIAAHHGQPRARLGLVVSIVSNLALLGVFKYGAFLIDNLNVVFGLHLDVPTVSLPVGISFYTFQTISYVVDVYRGDVRAQRSFLSYFLFVSLFHQLVAGPIVRYEHIAREIEQRHIVIAEVARGMVRFCVGLFKKVYIANIAGEAARVYLEGDLQGLSMAESWLGALLYSLQIFFDFSAYSDMAIGLGWMVGFHYHENFDRPYLARSATDFWRRWHISLGTFFRDYVYVPLGGKLRHGYRNLFIVWGLTGLWHGASWNFVLWGLFYGTLIAAERLFLGRWLERAPRFVGHVYLVFIAIVGWMLFYFTDLDRLGEYYGIMFGLSGAPATAPEFLSTLAELGVWLVMALLMCGRPLVILPVGWRHRLEGLLLMESRQAIAVSVLCSLCLLLLSVSLLVGRSYNPFLYFRF